MYSETINLFGYTLYSQSIFILLGFLFAFYVVWRESQIEGFDFEAIFDYVILSLLGGLLVGRLTYGLDNYRTFGFFVTFLISFTQPGINMVGILFGFLFTAFLWVRYKRWSIWRISDITMLGITGAVSIYMLYFVLVKQRFELLISFGVLLFTHSILIYLRRLKFPFGSILGISLISLPIVLGISFYNPQIFITLSVPFVLGMLILVNRIINGKEKNMNKKHELPKDFIKEVKEALIQKEKELEADQALLEKEDDYTDPEGRDTLNNEFVDEASEDETHERVLAQKESLSEMKLQIKKALSMIELGHYGICEICHEPIDLARLRALPQATTCTSCAEKVAAKE